MSLWKRILIFAFSITWAKAVIITGEDPNTEDSPADDAQFNEIFKNLNVPNQDFEPSSYGPGDCVQVDIIGQAGANICGLLKELGAKACRKFRHLWTGCVPIDRFETFKQHEYVAGYVTADQSMDLSSPHTDSSDATAGSGSVGEEAPISTFADVARQEFKIDGSGVKVCIYSDSFDCLGGYADDIASGDLPPGVAFDDVCTGSKIDEGRAIAQIIYDVAPGAELFVQSISSFVDFVSKISVAVDKECDIVLDDFVFNVESYFQYDMASQEIDRVVQDYGIAWFSSAANQGQYSYEAPFKAVETDSGEICHNFAADAGLEQLEQELNIVTDRFRFEIQWDQPSLFASDNVPENSDLSVTLNFPTFNTLIQVPQIGSLSNFPARSYTIPITLPSFRVPFPVFVKICVNTGTAPEHIKWIIDNISTTSRSTLDPYDFASPAANAGTTRGHFNLASAASVCAAESFSSPGYGVDPAVAQTYSGYGGTTIRLDEDGNRLVKPIVPKKPNFCASDTLGNTVFTTFRGTSAAVGVAAGVAALILERNSALTPAQLLWLMESTSRDMDDPFTTNLYGFIDTITAQSVLTENDSNRAKNGKKKNKKEEEEEELFDGIDPNFDIGFDFKTGYGFVDALEAVRKSTGGKKGKKEQSDTDLAEEELAPKTKRRRKRYHASFTYE